MRRAVPGIVLFLCGIAIGYALLQGMNRTVDSKTRQAALDLLDRPPGPSGNNDNPYVRAAAKLEPCVVNIDTSGTKSDSETRDIQAFQGLGSGVIISPDGYIVTNNHVIEDATIIRVTTSTEQKYSARLIGADPASDLAVLKIDAKTLPFVDLGDSNRLKVGEYVIAIGNPLGVGTTVTHGIISALNRKNLQVSENVILKDVVQIDAPINKGNSGGALGNMAGQLIGINSAIRSVSGGNEGIGFAIPSNTLRTVLKDILAHSKSNPSQEQPFIGVRPFDVSVETAMSLGLKPNEGVVVEVYGLTPAENAGIASGTVVVAVDGKSVTSPEMLRKSVRMHKVGDVVVLTVIRSDRRREDVKVTVGARPQFKQQ